MNLESRRLGRPPARFAFGGSYPDCSAKGQLGREKIPLWGMTRRLRREMGLSSHGFSPVSVPEGFQRASGKPFGAPAGAYPCPGGMTRRLRRGSGACSPMFFSPASVPEGFQRASGKPFGAPAGAHPLPGWGLTRRLRRGSRACCLLVFSPVSVPEGFQRASGKPFGAPAGAYPCPGGMTRRLRRGSRACSPMGRSHFSFGGERKVCKRKPAARRLREKGSYCPF